MNRTLLLSLVMPLLATPGVDAQEAPGPVLINNHQNWGWDETYVIENDFVTVSVVPDAGGRVMEYSLGGVPSLWINPKTLGQTFADSEEVKPNQWRNFGGYRVIPLPLNFAVGADGQRTHRWPPPVVWGTNRYVAKITDAPTGGQALTVTSGVQQLPVPHFDRKSQAFAHPDGIEERLQYARTISVEPRSSVVQLIATVTNRGDRPVKRGFMASSQHPARSTPERTDGENFWLYIPFNPQHKLDNGEQFRIRGTAEQRWRYVDRNRQKLDRNNPEHVEKYLNTGSNWKGEVSPGVYGLHYDYDLMSGFDIVASDSWVCYVNQTNRTAFAKLFDPYEKERFTYVDGSNFSAFNSGLETGYLESEVRTPIHDLQPGESFSYRETWGAAKIENAPVVAVNRAGIVTRKLRVDPARSCVTGSYGVFYEGRAVLVLHRAGVVGPTEIDLDRVNPHQPLIVDQGFDPLGDATSIRLVLRIDGHDADLLLDSLKPAPGH